VSLPEIDRTATPVVRPDAPVDLLNPGRYHVIGVGGPGMSAIAIVLAEMGHTVSGSDLRDLPVLDRLRAAGVAVELGHRREVVHGVDAVTASSAIPERNIEWDEAHRVGVPALRRAGMLASICARARSIGVAGTHGKTTTTSMLAFVLSEAAFSPGFIVGGDVTDMGTGAHWSGGDLFVVEVDESDGTHLELPLESSIVTNVDVDHLDHFGTVDAIEKSFAQYLDQVPGIAVVCVDDPVLVREAHRRHAAGRGVVGYGLTAPRDHEPESGALDQPSTAQAFTRVWAGPVSASHGVQTFDVWRRDTEGITVGLGRISLPLRGRHNVANALAVISMALEYGVRFEEIAQALGRFGGVARRFDFRGVHGGATFVDDYAHLPAEIDAVLRAARDSGDDWERIVAVFQPNRYHRMSIMSPDYAQAFDAADLVVITDIYASGTTPIPGVTGKLVVNAICDARPRARVVWMPRRDQLVDYLANEVRRGDLCISMGCGDVAGLPGEVLARRRERDPDVS
jgi:UDP-N-acetylmuramate--alanine ligase